MDMGLNSQENVCDQVAYFIAYTTSVLLRVVDFLHSSSINVVQGDTSAVVIFTPNPRESRYEIQPSL